MAEVACPFCGVTSPEAMVIEAHIEENHAEDHRTTLEGPALGSVFTPRDCDIEPTETLDSNWVKCTRQGCGEYVLLGDIDDHLVVHASVAASDTGSMAPASGGVASNGPPSPPSAKRQAKLKDANQRNGGGIKRRSNPTLLEYFSGRSVHGNAQTQLPKARLPVGRLGRRELGPHAFEKEMPAHVRRHLLNDALPKRSNVLDRNGKLVKATVVQNETSGLMPVLANLCDSDMDVQVAYLCHPATKHINKLRCDGNFCGYWNVQMLLSHLQGTDALPNMPGIVPDVLQIQDQIEQAWDNNILSHGRTETGGIRGTRKWIGTSEAVAYFTQQGISVEAHAFSDEEHDLAVIALLDHVEAYFMGGVETAEQHGTSHITRLGPIYFQRFGHSMTIVGLQRNSDGSRQLLVFDPSFETSVGMRSLLDGGRSRASVETLLKAYRRSDQALARWDEFEIIVSRAQGAAG